MQEGYNVPRFMLDGGSCSQGCKLISVTCRKMHYGECPVGTGNCFNYGKIGHKKRDCPIF